jgi:hypothetical protein
LRVPREAKVDPELPESLSPRQRDRNIHLLELGLSDYYVELCFEANRLYGAAKEARCESCMTSFVRYEGLVKRRKAPTAAETSLIERLKKEQARGAFAAHSCSISDLQGIKLLESRRRLGKGELSSIAFAMKMKSPTKWPCSAG